MSKTETLYTGNLMLWTYRFNAVYGNSEENKKFWEWTPSGTLEVSCVKDNTFQVGKEYYLDLSLAEGGK